MPSHFSLLSFIIIVNTTISGHPVYVNSLVCLHFAVFLACYHLGLFLRQQMSELINFTYRNQFIISSTLCPLILSSPLTVNPIDIKALCVHSNIYFHNLILYPLHISYVSNAGPLEISRIHQSYFLLKICRQVLPSDWKIFFQMAMWLLSFICLVLSSQWSKFSLPSKL